HLGAGQQPAGIEVAGQLVVEPAHGQIPLPVVSVRGHGDVGLIAADGAELAPVALLAGLALADLRRGPRPGGSVRSGARAATVGDGAHQALPLDSNSRGGSGRGPANAL